MNMFDPSKFIIGSGFHCGPHYNDPARKFVTTWHGCLHRYVDPDRIVVITTGENFPFYGGKIIPIQTANLGHMDGLTTDAQQQLCGWSAAVMALCLIAYNCKRDLVYVEQDALCFGPWLEQAYADMGDRGMVFGQKHESEPWMPCSQSLFVIRWWFLLEFVKRYLALPPDVEMNPENKFTELESQRPHDFARLSFGVDRCRPLPWDAPGWYAQRFSGEELAEARKRGLL